MTDQRPPAVQAGPRRWGKSLRRPDGSDQSSWRRELQAAKIKFDDEAKRLFLEEVLRHGKLALAAKNVGVSVQTIRNHLNNDPEFAEMHDWALAQRADIVTERLEREALEGHDEPIINPKTGEIVGYKRVLESGIRLAMLKRYDPEYKDRSETTVNGVVGVLVAPAQMSPHDWIAHEMERTHALPEPGTEPEEILDSSPRAPHE